MEEVMKKTILLLLFFFSIPIVAQEKKTATKGSITFEASIPFYEAVEAKNNSVFSVLNTKNNSINFVVEIKEFQFERSLMQDHFNSYYMESNKYPKAIFKGKIENWSLSTTNTNPSQYYIDGKITIHGVTKNIRVGAAIFKTETNTLVIQSDFDLNTDDFKIEIPFSALSKVSKKVTVSLQIEFQ